MTKNNLKIGPDMVVTFNYTLRNDKQEVIDSSDETGPDVYLHGSDNTLPGIEKNLEGHVAGDKLTFVLPPEEAFGMPSGNEPTAIPIKEFGEAELEVGMVIETEDEEGEPVFFWIVDMDEENAMISLDHPLAGETLHWEIEIVEVREATEEELEHGHAHGECCDCDEGCCEEDEEEK